MTIILDNGHGSDTAGKRSPIWKDRTQLLEWQFNRKIVNLIAKKLAKLDIKHHILVSEDIDISLHERVKRANKLAQKEDCLLISIHANAGGGRGWEAFTSIGQTQSDIYANHFYSVAREVLEGHPIRVCEVDGDEDKESNFYILKKTICPAILTENMFMDNEADCCFIMSDEGVKKIIDLHVKAICRCVR